jgi:hypothetical protein
MTDDEQAEMVTVHIWEGNRRDDADDLVASEDPDVYELPVTDPDYGILDALADDEKVVLADDVANHSTYAFLVPDESRPATLNVHTNPNAHDPTDWNDAAEGGLAYLSADDRPPYKCEMWGRVMFWVEAPEQGGETA